MNLLVKRHGTIQLWIPVLCTYKPGKLLTGETILSEVFINSYKVHLWPYSVSKIKKSIISSCKECFMNLVSALCS